MYTVLELSKFLSQLAMDTKIIASLTSVIKIVKYFVIVGEGGLEGGTKIPQNDNGAPLSVIKIVKYCGQKYNVYKQYNCILPVTCEL